MSSSDDETTVIPPEEPELTTDELHRILYHYYFENHDADDEARAALADKCLRKRYAGAADGPAPTVTVADTEETVTITVHSATGHDYTVDLARTHDRIREYGDNEPEGGDAHEGVTLSAVALDTFPGGGGNEALFAFYDADEPCVNRDDDFRDFVCNDIEFILNRRIDLDDGEVEYSPFVHGDEGNHHRVHGDDSRIWERHHFVLWDQSA